MNGFSLSFALFMVTMGSAGLIVERKLTLGTRI